MIKWRMEAINSHLKKERMLLLHTHSLELCSYHHHHHHLHLHRHRHLHHHVGAIRRTSPLHHTNLHIQKQSSRSLLFPPRLCQKGKEPRAHASPPPIEEDVINDEELDDDELDALFEEHGEVVVADPNPKPTSADADDDASSLALAVALAEAANDGKGADILVLHVKPLIYWTRFFVIATAFSRPQLAAINKRMRDIGEERFKVIPRGDTKPNAWTLLDYGDVVVHVFLPKERAFYNLEEFYANAPSVELPFKSETAP